MKLKTSLSILLCAFLLLACDKTETLEKTPPAENDVTSSMTDSKVEEEQSSEDNTSNEIMDENNLYLSQVLDRTHYENDEYLALGEAFAVGNAGDMYGDISLDSYEIITDEFGSNRQALLLWFTETNTSDQPIEVGLYGMESMVSPDVFYGDLHLNRLSHYKPDAKFFDEDYIENKHVQYGDELKTKVQSCAYTVTINPGESRSCYSHYSYAGAGEYLVSQIIDATNDILPTNFKSYLIEVK